MYFEIILWCQRKCITTNHLILSPVIVNKTIKQNNIQFGYMKKYNKCLEGRIIDLNKTRSNVYYIKFINSYDHLNFL